jgi:uncharacterized protein YabN with tetrapyrrole methylase and pyrophosphatase domain
MCVFNDYIRLQDELREFQKEIIGVTKNYNNVLKIFQNGNIIDSANAEKIKEKYDELQKANERITSKKEEFQQIEKGIEEYLAATNGMAIRHKFVKEGIDQAMIFDLEINTYGEQIVKSIKEI